VQLARQIDRESYTVDYAGFWIRLAAMLVDGLILGVVVWVFNGLWPMAFGLGWMGGTAGATISYGEVGGVFWVLAVLVPFLIVVAYFIGLWGWRGQTVGMMALRIRIARFTGEAITWVDAVMRFLGFIISVLFVFIGHFWIAFDSRRQGWHDKIAETFVIRIPRR